MECDICGMEWPEVGVLIARSRDGKLECADCGVKRVNRAEARSEVIAARQKADAPTMRMCQDTDKSYNPHRLCIRYAKWQPAQGAPMPMCGVHYRAWERRNRKAVVSK